ncbi:MAG: RNA polymerase sigma factor, partial [Firmicutes bacterium]|nr:RNA polymerase sigma factor [Bacillota bacterium]
MRRICDDNQLMRQAQNGDNRAFEQLVLKYRADTIRFAFRFVQDLHVAEDLAQESFASIYVHRQNYKPKHEFKTYLYAVVRNKCIDF